MKKTWYILAFISFISYAPMNFTDECDTSCTDTSEALYEEDASIIRNMEIVSFELEDNWFEDNETIMRSEAKLKLFVYPGCPYCEKVRNFLVRHGLINKVTILNANDKNIFALLKSTSGSTMCPFLVDETNKRKMPESNHIIAYIASLYNIKV